MVLVDLPSRSCLFPWLRNPKLTVLCTDISQTFAAIPTTSRDATTDYSAYAAQSTTPPAKSAIKSSFSPVTSIAAARPIFV